MNTLGKTTTRNLEATVAATGVRFAEGKVSIALSDGREVSLPLEHPYLGWLKAATPEQQANWQVEPHGFAVYWPDLDDGIEVAHLLWPDPLA